MIIHGIWYQSKYASNCKNNHRPDYNGGVLFAITDAYRRITFFGLELRAEADGQIQVNVYWTDEDQEQTQLGQVWDFNANSSQSKWLK